MLAPSQRLRIIVGGMVGEFPLGGVAWDYLHYVLGLHELGHDVARRASRGWQIRSATIEQSREHKLLLWRC
jgi:hypothetical protein